MVFTRRRQTKRLIQRSLQKYKHIVDASFTNVVGSAGVNATTLIQGADNPIVTSTNIVQTRARVRAVYLEITFSNNNTAAGGIWKYDWYLMFNPQLSLTNPPPATVGQQTTKNYVIKQGDLILQTQATQANTIHKITGVVKIPTKYQRFMIGDALIFAWQSTSTLGVDNVKVKCIYKEIRG